MSNWCDDIMFDTKDYSRWAAQALIHLRKVGNEAVPALALLFKEFSDVEEGFVWRSKEEQKDWVEVCRKRALCAVSELTKAGVLKEEPLGMYIVNQELLERMSKDFIRCYEEYDFGSGYGVAPWS